MKSRSLPPVTCTYYGTGYGSVTGVSGPYYETYIPKEESISSEIGPRKHYIYYNGRRYSLPYLKNVVHSKYERSHKGWSGYRHNTTTARTGGYIYSMCEFSSSYSDVAKVIPSIPLQEFISEGVRAMYPKFKADTNLLNFIYELREIKSLIPSVKNIRIALDSINNAVTKISAVTKVFSEAVLNLNYGIQPLISDIFSILTDIESFKLKLSDFLRRAGKPQVRHYKREILADDVTSSVVSYPGGEDYYSEASLVEGSFIMTMYYGYTVVGIPDTTKIPAISKSLLAKFYGLRTGALPAAFWNALPFSFLIDYIVRVGDWLEQLDLGALDITFTPLQACYSTKLKTRTSYNMRMRPGSKNDGSGLKYFNIDETTYRRTRIDDLSLLSLYIDPVPNIDSFDIREQVLVVNLINANRH